MSNSDFFSEVREREQKRLERSLEKARETVLRNRFSSSNEFHSVEEFTDFEACLNRLVKIVLLCQALSAGMVQKNSSFPERMERIS